MGEHKMKVNPTTTITTTTINDTKIDIIISYLLLYSIVT
jgi:hypothetical protein